jgi:hypothetical protein
MNETEVLNEFFIWEENNLTEPKMKSVNNGVNEHKDIMNETKTDLTPNDWRDITDPKLRNIMRQRAWRKTNKDKVKKYNDSSKRKAYYENNKEEILGKRKDYYESNKDKFKEQSKSYYEDNKEKIKNQVKTYCESNPDKTKERKKNYYNKNKVKVIKKSKDYYNVNKEKKKEYDKIYRDVNKDEIRLRSKNYYESNKDRIYLYQKNYNKINRDKKNFYNKNRLKTDIQYKLGKNLRGRLYKSINGNFKSGSAVKDLGCSIEELKSYLESKFLVGMTWDNWSNDGWHIDHIKPLASFDLTDRKQFLEACHYTNLQPMWAKDNLVKSDKII